MGQILANVDVVAAAVGAIVWFVLGAAWYMNPWIAKLWQQSGGIEIADDDKPDPKVFVLTLLAYFAAALVTSAIATSVGVATTLEGLTVGLTVGAGFAVPLAAISAIYDNKPNPFTWFWVNGLFNAIGLTAVGGVLGAFAS